MAKLRNTLLAIGVTSARDIRFFARVSADSYVKTYGDPRQSFIKITVSQAYFALH
jgi:hypothetical protein